jgi:ABC-type Zn uptake system ZnuABC Zn-binding protein ZnuA
MVCAGGCGGQDSASPQRAAEPVHVLTTVYALADIARQVGGDRVEVEWYVENGQSLAELAETPERRNQFRTAELVVTRGAPDPWTLEGAGNPYQDRKILRIDTLPSTRDGDPAQYQWLDPQTAIEVADELAVRLSTLRPRREKYFKANAADFTRKVAELMEETSGKINRTSGGGPFMSLDRGFVPLARRFGLEEVRVTSILPTQVSDYSAKQLREQAREAGAGVIYLSSETPAPLVRDWQARLEMPALTLDPMGTSAPTGRSTYLALLRYNLSQLEAGAARARPTTATTRYMAETVDPAERNPPPPPPPEEEPATPAPPPPENAGIHIPPIPNPYARVVQDPTTRPRDGRSATRRSAPQPAPARPQTPGIRVPPIPRLFGPGGDEPTTRPRTSATLPSPTDPFAR